MEYVLLQMGIRKGYFIYHNFHKIYKINRYKGEVI